MKNRQNLLGFHAVIARLEKHPQTMKILYIQKGRMDARMQMVLRKAGEWAIAVEEVDKDALNKISGGAVHQGVIGVAEFVAPITDLSDLLNQLGRQTQKPLLLVLDGVTDPHNLGACLRVADAAGVDAVIAPKDKTAPINETVARVACGAAESVSFLSVTNLARTLDELKEYDIWVYGTSDAAEKSLFETDLTVGLALVLGAEGKGLRHLTLKKCDDLLSIPMAGMVSSLNVSVATGVCLFEAVRQRGG